jgi:hypothetical protein
METPSHPRSEGKASSPRRSALGRRRAMRCTAATTALLLSVSHRSRPAQMAAGDQDSGYPISPELRPADVLLRYFYDGGTLRQGRLCRMITPADTDTVSGLALLHALHDDGVDLECFYPCVRETEASGGSWLRFLRGVVGAPPAEVEGGDDITLPLPREASKRRIDLKLFRRERLSGDELRAGQDSAPSGRIARTGYYGVGV